MIEQWSLTVPIDYGQFYLFTAPSSAAASVDIAEVVETAVNADKIAKRGPLTVIICPHQNNFAMRLSVELWASQPPDDLADWQEVFVLGVEIDQSGLRYDSAPGFDGISNIPIPIGTYTMTVAGKGFVTTGWPGLTEPGDVWSIRLWPDDGTPENPLHVKRWAGAV